MEILPLHLHVANRLEEEFRHRKPGEKLDSERELSRRVGVSQTTIAKALAVLTQKGLVVRRHGSGTYISDLPRDRHLGVLLEYDIGGLYSAYFFRSMAQKCRRLCEEKGVLMRFYAGFADFENPPREPTCREFLHDLEQGTLSGLVAMAGAERTGAVTLARRHGLPVVGHALECSHRVIPDRQSTLHALVEDAIAQGRRRFALLEWKEGPYAHDLAARYSIREDFLAALHHHGIEPVPEWVRGDLHPLLPGSGWEGFREIWTARGEEHPDVVIVGDEHLLAGVNQALLAFKTPQDALSIYSFCTKGNQFTLAYPVVRVETNVDEVAAVCVRVLLGAVNDPGGTPGETLVPLQFHLQSEPLLKPV